jgi:hypothetical protein
MKTKEFSLRNVVSINELPMPTTLIIPLIYHHNELSDLKRNLVTCTERGLHFEELKQGWLHSSNLEFGDSLSICLK